MTTFAVGTDGKCTCGWHITASSDRYLDFEDRVESHAERDGHAVTCNNITSQHPVENSWITECRKGKSEKARG